MVLPCHDSAPLVYNLLSPKLIYFKVRLINRLPDGQPLLHHKLLRQPLPQLATMLVECDGAGGDQRASEERANHPTRDGPCAAFGRRGRMIGCRCSAGGAGGATDPGG